jgi:hypothetical protein
MDGPELGDPDLTAFDLAVQWVYLMGVESAACLDGKEVRSVPDWANRSADELVMPMEYHVVVTKASVRNG